ncbi:MAG TPA: VOC family protein [Thermoanaerobaculia bacterium]|nr:VOC family protein [Thermoanaerobaculia bacterium]
MKKLGLLGCLFTLACATTPTHPPEKAAMQAATIDHVIVGIADLDQGIRLLTELTGVAPERGGQHPGRGTQNALLSLGPRTYLELIAPVSGPPPEMQFLSSLQQLTPIGWAIGTKDLDATKGRLEAAGFKVTAPRDGSRVRPDGKVLQWRTAGLEDVPGELTPFLIEWSAQTAHPATTSPGGCTLESIEIVVPQVEKLNQLVAELRLGAAVRSGATPELSLTLACPKGQVALSSAKRP